MEAAAATSAAPTGRFYKSRKSRPCDACRKRKVACDMPTGPPCQRCRGKTLSCTFDHGPGERRRRPVATAQPSLASSSPPRVVDTMLPTLSQSSHIQSMWFENHQAMLLGPEGGDPFHLRQVSAHLDVGGGHVLETPDFMEVDMSFAAAAAAAAAVPGSLPHGPGRSPPQQDFQSPATTRSAGSASSARSVLDASFSPTQSSAAMLSSSSAASPGGSLAGSLEFLPGAFSFYIGPTGVSDVQLLGRQTFGRGGVAPASVPGLQYRNMTVHQRRGRSRPPVIFGLTDHALLDKAEPKPPDAEAATETAWTALWRILDTATAWSLLQLYARFVDPYFPILARHQIPAGPDALSNMSLALLTAICATALPFVVYDRSLYALLLRPPSSEQLYRLCWLGIAQELHAPALGTLQACLLLQQRLPTNLYLNDTAFSWSLMATAVSVAQTIGLHREPAGWTDVPAWERRLRRRLWWALWSMEKWVALARGMPSHLADDEADVEPLQPDDTQDGLLFGGGGHDNNNNDTGDDDDDDDGDDGDDDDDDKEQGPSHASRHHHLYCLVGLTTILADIQRTFYTLRATRQTAGNLALSLEVGRAARVQLKAWRDALPASLQFRSRPAPDHPDHGRPPEPPHHLDGNASLHLSYIVTHMTLFRALLRPMDNAVHSHSHSHSNGGGHEARAVARGALLCVREFVEFVEGLTPVQWNAFWHGWSRANFAMAGAFLVQLLHVLSSADGGGGGGGGGTTHDDEDTADRYTAAAPPRARAGLEDEYGQLLGWIKRWRWAMRVASNGAAGAKGLTNLGLLRFETCMVHFGDVGESI